MAEEKEYRFGSYRSEMQAILDEFNNATKGIFYVESRTLIEPTNSYGFPTKGIIVEHVGSPDKFKEHFEQYSEELSRLAHKLDKRTHLYQYPFVREFTDIDKWVDYDDKKVAYNYEI